MAQTPEPTISLPTRPKTPPLPRYSHEVTVAAITSLYEMVKRVHADSTEAGWDLAYPPPGGWPMLTYELFKGSKTQAAVELMRHIPYFRDNEGFCQPGGSPNPPFIMDDTWTINYTDPDWVKYYAEEYPGWELEEKKWDLYAGHCTLPPHMVRLTECYRDGSDVVVDTETGLVLWHRYIADTLPHWLGTMHWVKERDNYDEQAQSLTLRGAQRFDVEDFVEICKEAFIKMYWIPMMEDGQFSVCEWSGEWPRTPGDEHSLRMQIMTSAGWPSEGWDKAKAQREMIELDKETYQAHMERDDQSD